jgi:uncharacterized protein YchJ
MSKRSRIWTYFVSKEGGKKAQCLLCTNDSRVFATTNSATSQLWDHLNASHHKEWEKLELLQIKKQKEDNTKQLTLHQMNQQGLNEHMEKAIVKYVVQNHISFASIDSETFHGLFSIFHYTPPSLRTLVTLVDKYALNIRIKLASLIQNSTQTIALTTDGWTDNANHRFLSLTAHFIDVDWKLQSRCLDIIELDEAHTGEVIEEIIKERLQHYIVHDKKIIINVASITTDNGANMLKAVRLTTWNGIECFAHTLQLCIKDSLDGEEHGIFTSLLYKIRKYCSRIHKSSTAQRILIDIQKQNSPDLRPLVFIMDVKTRWNSTYLMLERLKRIGSVSVSEFANRFFFPILLSRLILFRNKLEDLSHEEWKEIFTLIDFLKPFYEITQELEGDQYPTLSVGYPLILKLMKIVHEFDYKGIFILPL